MPEEHKPVVQGQYNVVLSDIERGEIMRYDQAKLLEAARVLAAFPRTGHEQTAAALLIHNLQLAHTLRQIDRSNRYVQWFVIGLTIITILLAGLQTYFMVCPRANNLQPPATSTP